MRKNLFGESYCHTAAEVRSILDDHENGYEVFVSDVSEPDPDGEGPADRVASATISENESGDVVCHIEAPTLDALEAIVAELELEMP